MRKFIALDADGKPTEYILNVPAGDLSEEEWAEHVAAGRIDPDGPTGALWEKTDDKKGKAAPQPAPVTTEEEG